MTPLKNLWYRLTHHPSSLPPLDVPPAPGDDPDIRHVRGRLIEYKIRVEQLRREGAKQRTTQVGT